MNYFLHQPQLHHLLWGMFPCSCLNFGQMLLKFGCSGGRAVRDSKRFGKQDLFLPCSHGPPSRSCFSDPGSYPSPSSWQSLRSSQGVLPNKLNDYQCFEALISLPLSGDQKPSHLMNRMLALLPDDYKPDFILRGVFL